MGLLIMIDKQVFKQKMDELMILFPSWGFDKSNEKEALTWYNKFSDLTNKEFSYMVDSFIKNDKFNPTVGGLRQYIVEEPKKSRDQIEHEQMLMENGML